MQLYDVSQTANNIYIFMEYCNGGNLREFINKKKKKPTDTKEVVRLT